MNQPLTASHEDADKWAEKTLADLSLEKKIAQMICEQMRGEYKAEDSTEFQYLLEMVRDHGIGAFVLYGGTPHNIASLLNRLYEVSFQSDEFSLIVSHSSKSSE